MKSPSKIAAALMLAAACFTVNSARAQNLLAGWAVNAIAGAQTNSTTYAATTVGQNLVVTPLTKGSGINPVTTSGVFGGNNWTNDVVGGTGATDTESNAIAGGHFITYSVQAAPGYTVSFSTNVLYWHNSATGPYNGELQYSSDGINYTNVAVMQYTNGNFAATSSLTNNLSGIGWLQNVPSTTTNYFRIVNWGATGSFGTWYINNASPVTMPDFQVIGSATAVPPPQNLVTWWPNVITGTATNNTALTANTTNQNVIVSALAKGPGINPVTTSEVFGGNNWTNNAPGGNSGNGDSEANAIAGGHYLTYSVQAETNYTISFLTNYMYIHNSATGPTNGELQYSTDGVNFTNILYLPYFPGAGTGVLTNNLANFNFLQNVPTTTTNYFRIVNWGATGNAGTWYIDDGQNNTTPLGTNDFAVVGGVFSILGVIAPTNVVVTPASLSASAGQTVSFNLTANGSPTTNFWYEIANGATNLVLGPTTASSLTLSNVLGGNSGSYFVVLTNSSGTATSSIVALTVTNDPNIEVEPASAQGLVDGQVQFAVTTFGTAPINYQWYFSDTNGDLIAPVANLGDGSTFSGANGSVLTFANLQPGDLTNFVVVVTNVYGAVTSSVASMYSSSNNPSLLAGTSGTLSTTAAVLALWDFDGEQFTNLAVNPNSLLSPAPFIGYGVASAVGNCYEPGTSPFSGATDPNDVGFDASENAYVFTPYGFEQPSPNFSWGTENYPAVTGTNKDNGVQFDVSTFGAQNIQVSYDARVSATASEYYRLQYTTNGVTWIDYPASSSFDGLSGSGNAGYYTFKYDLTGFPGVNNNPDFGVRVVSEWANSATYGINPTNFWVGTANNYTSGASGNSAAGTVTYDLVAVTGDAITNNNVAPTLSILNMASTNAEYATNMVDTNTLVINFSASSSQMPATNLAFSVQSLDTVSAGRFVQTINPSFTVTNLGGTNFAMSIVFNNGFIPDPVDAAPILITATDTNGESAATWFLLTASAINQPPTNTLTSLPATNLLANTSLVIPFYAGSARDGYTNFTFTLASDNNTLIPAGNLVIGGNTNTGNFTLTVTPAPGQIGNGLITVSIDDNDPAEPRTSTANVAIVVRPNTNVVAIDYFDYDNSGSLDVAAQGYWTHLSGIEGQLQVANDVATINDGNTENLQAQLLNAPFKTNSGAILYSSFTVNIESASGLPTGNGSYITAFNDGSGNTADVEDCLVVATNGAAPGYYRLGIANEVGATALNAQMFPQDLTPGVAYTILTSLSLSNGFSTLWINPSNQASAHVRDTTVAAATNLYSINYFELRESGTVEGIVNIGALAVGTAFDSVFYPPQANPDNLGLIENTTNAQLNPLANDAGSDLNIINVSPDTNGNATISGGTNILYTPTNGFTGVATVGYSVRDDLGEVTNATITVTVTNDPPLANPIVYSVPENSVNFALNPLTNDLLQTPGGSLSLVSVSETDGNGAATISGNKILFTPVNNFTGAATISYTITDNLGGTNSSTITANVANLTPIPVTAQLSGGNLVLAWTNAAFTLQFSTNVVGPYVAVPAATSPFTVAPTNAAGFYRLVH